MDTSIATAGLQNFWFGGQVYRITSAGIRDDVAFATVEPTNEQLQAKLIRQLMQSRNINTTDARGFKLFADERGAFDQWASEQQA